jgi:hypothetical protein
LDSGGSEQEEVVGSCEQGNETSGYIKGDLFTTCQNMNMRKLKGPEKMLQMVGKGQLLDRKSAVLL